MARTVAKAHLPGAVHFDALQVLNFDPITLSASDVNTNLNVPFALPSAIKILNVAAVLSGTIAGACSINVAYGTAAEGGSAVGVDAVAVSGTTVFSSDEALTMTAEDTQTFQPTNPDTIYPPGASLNVRLVTAASTTGTLKVTVLAKIFDQSLTKPLYTSAGVLQI